MQKKNFVNFYSYNLLSTTRLTAKNIVTIVALPGRKRKTVKIRRGRATVTGFFADSPLSKDGKDTA